VNYSTLFFRFDFARFLSLSFSLESHLEKREKPENKNGGESGGDAMFAMVTTISFFSETSP